MLLWTYFILDDDEEGVLDNLLQCLQTGSVFKQWVVFVINFVMLLFAEEESVDLENVSINIYYCIAGTCSWYTFISFCIKFYSYLHVLKESGDFILMKIMQTTPWERLGSFSDIKDSDSI